MTFKFRNKLLEGDCLEVVKSFDDESVDLIYADPPFATNRLFAINGKNGMWGESAFADRWPEGIWEYNRWMKPRLQEFRRLLKPKGLLYLHSDWHSSHYLKVSLDLIFGISNFVNEIIWKRQSSHNDCKQGAKNFGRIHDTILVYSKSREHTWNALFSDYTEEYLHKCYRYVEPHSNRRYAVGDLTGPGGPSKGNPKFKFMGVTRYWRYSKKKMNELLESGKIVQNRPGDVPKLKRYLDEMRGNPLQDIWVDINHISRSNEWTGYPTQKPEKLLERIILSSSNEEDVVLDPFCGSGTSLVVASSTKRNWIGIDMSRKALAIARRRLTEKGEIPTRPIRPINSFPIAKVRKDNPNHL